MLHPLYEPDGDEARVGVGFQYELRHRGYEPLPLPAHDVDHGGRGVYDLREGAYALPVLGDDLGADYVLNEIAALGQLRVGPVYEHAPALEAHGGVHVLHAFERGEHGPLVD